MTPAEILQSYLDDVGAAVLTGDWDAYQARVLLPFQLSTQTATLTVSTTTDLRAGFDDFHQMLRIQRVTDYVRIVDRADLMPDGQISGHYRSHLMAGGHRMMPPFKSEITLRLVGNLWRATAITNELTNSRWPILTPSLDRSSKGSH